MTRWEPDAELGSGFVQATLVFPDDDQGPVVATLVRNDPAVAGRRGAVLYLHGFIDYFFQRHLAAAFNGRGFDFYALDLRKYGRSMRGATHPNFCRRVDDYFPEITQALDIIGTEGGGDLVLMGHSTGALTGAIYAKDGPRRDRVARLILNSPFLEFREARWQTRAAAAAGAVVPFWPQRNAVNRWYARSLHRSQLGEWDFNLAYKPLDGFPVYFGWVRAIVAAHDRLAAGLALPQPVLVLHSDKSADGDTWSEEFRHSDVILDVDDMRRLGPRLGPLVRLKEIAGGVHDLVLSPPAARDAAIAAMLDWAG